jgi:hypothetical protein
MQNAAEYLAAVVLHTVRQPLCRHTIAGATTAAKPNAAAAASSSNVSTLIVSNPHSEHTACLVVLLLVSYSYAPAES